jgi:uncharacterized protein
MGDPTTGSMGVFDWSPGALIWINSRSREGGFPVVDEGPSPVAWVRLQRAISNRATYLRALDSPDPLTITIFAMIPDGRYRLMDQEIIEQLERRLGRLYARQRLGIERDHEARVFGGGINFFHIENWYSVHGLIRNALKLTGLYWRGRRNAEHIQVQNNTVRSRELPEPFDGFTILHISDMHVDMNEGAMRHLTQLLPELSYDICVLTGDFRGKTFGPFDATLDGLARVRSHVTAPVYGVLGNHDTICMVPGLETMGIRMLLNEGEPIVRRGQHIYLAGIDDAHYYRVDNIEKAASEIPDGAFSILLSHTPEIYRQAAHAGFDLLLSGHTHGGQICLPGSIPLTLDSVLPRNMGSGAWEYSGMTGYTSVGVGSCIVAVRINCPPTITLHHLQRA